MQNGHIMTFFMQRARLHKKGHSGMTFFMQWGLVPLHIARAYPGPRTWQIETTCNTRAHPRPRTWQIGVPDVQYACAPLAAHVVDWCARRAIRVRTLGRARAPITYVQIKASRLANPLHKKDHYLHEKDQYLHKKDKYLHKKIIICIKISLFA